MAEFTTNVVSKGIFEPDTYVIGNNTGQLDTVVALLNSGSIQRIFYTATASDEFPTSSTWSASNYATINSDIEATAVGDRQAKFLEFINDVTGSRGYSGLTRTNAKGYAQLLYMDVYPAYGFSPLQSTNSTSSFGDPTVAAPILLYFHGGGFDVGYSNFEATPDETINQFRRAGIHCITVEYRRGWTAVTGSLFNLTDVQSPERLLGVTSTLMGYSLTDQNTTPPSFSIDNGTEFLQTALGTSGMATIDAIDAWDWVDDNIQTVLPNAIKKYIIQGNSAGGAQTAQLTFANDLGNNKLNRLEKKVIGSIESFGSYTASVEMDTIIRNREIPYPVIMQSAGADKLVPFRDNHLFYQTNAPVAKGTYDQYATLSESNKNVYWYNTPLGGHGYDNWDVTFNLLGTDDLREVEYVNFALNIINKSIGGETLPPSHWVTRVDTTLVLLSSSLQYPGPGYYTSLTEDSDIFSLYNTASMFYDIPFTKGISTPWFYTSSTVEGTFETQSVSLVLSNSTGLAIEYVMSESARRHQIASNAIGQKILQTNNESFPSNYTDYSLHHYGDINGTAVSKDFHTYAEMSTSIASASTAITPTDPFL